MLPRRATTIAVEFCGLFIVLAGVLYAVANHEALLARLSYWFQESREQTSELTDDDILHVADAGEVQGNRIVIPRLGLAAPLVESRSSEVDDVLTALEGGVVRYPGTAQPGAAGLTFLTGHSSNYAWAPGRYRAVFALIDKLQPGDPIMLVQDGGTYVYRVTENRVVSAHDGSVLDAPEGGRSLRLMTCWPVGTTAQRLVVEAAYDASASRPSPVRAADVTVPSVDASLVHGWRERAPEPD